MAKETLLKIKKPFDNPERTRYYGLRVGDIVSPKTPLGNQWKEGIAEVIELGFTNNNRVSIKAKNGIVTEWIAEWCEILIKVEDRLSKQKKKEFVDACISDGRYVEGIISLSQENALEVEDIVNRFNDTTAKSKIRNILKYL